MGDEPQTLTRCHSCGLLQLYKACGWKSACSRPYNLKGIKGERGKFIFSFVFLLLKLISWHDACRPPVLGGGVV